MSVDLLVDFIGNKYKEDQVHPEVVGVMKTKNVTTLDLTVTTSSVPMSVYSNDDKYVLTRAPVETTKPYSQPAAAT